MHWDGFHGSKYDSQGHVLDFVQPALVSLAAVPHTVDVYCMVGSTVAVFAPQVVSASFLIKARFCRLFLFIFSICGFQVSRVSSFILMIVWVSVWGTISSFSCNFIKIFEVEREKRVLFVLPMFMSRPIPVSDC